MVLVTGGTGLVGAHLLLHLIENGESVRAIYRNLDAIRKTENLFLLYKKEALFEKIDWIQADITDVPSLELVFENIEYVYHCAALISFDPKDETILRKTNIEGTANMVNFCIAKNVKKLCFISSISALGDLKENETILTEASEWNPEKPHSDYAISKYGAEMEIWRGQQEGLETVIVNPGVILGPGFWEQGSGVLFKKIKNGFLFYSKGTTGIISIDDVVKIMIQLMKSEVKNERFILISSNILFQDLFNSIADALETKRPSIYITPFITNILWRIDWISATVFRTKRKLDRLTASACYSKSLYSNEKIKNLLKIHFTDIHHYIKKISNM
jgi:nucleoside-diphosphate-sugar epimerase